ncbi:nucleotide sugar dehydrogenase [Parasutterella secunda]|uniref:nucleotide sugar dehydrogenase n=1 Tax=Parasutterella secunda TaxID=626947 RepID=UPI0025A3E52F|nr:nucleotide sugar dehydrogenase [Parasutterella secunda]MDM8218488.1 nucleotide sugar dehydrogenase [Parasutterella secunda]
MKIAVIGIGYVGLSNAIVLAQHNEVVLVDVIEEKVNKINLKKSPIAEPLIVDYLEHRELNLSATLNLPSACIEADFVLVATPTDYNDQTNSFDTSSVEDVVKKVSVIAPQATIIIKSTIPLGFTEKLIAQGYKNIVFVPEFLREGSALYDSLYPSRLVIGDLSERGRAFAQLMMQGAIKKDIPVLYTQPTEAEAIKLFANTYLAMRVAFFNELDSYAWENGLDSQKIIEGVGLDPRIGSYYCNPSFGYGGYCLPKDTKQLLANYENIPQELISAIVQSNKTRKHFVVTEILKFSPKTVGVFKLAMKRGSDNCRSSAIFDIIGELQSAGIKVIVYDPNYYENTALDFLDFENSLEKFKEESDLIVANRFAPELKDVISKVLTRDLCVND